MEHKAACEPIIADNIPSYMRNQRHWILYHFGPSNKNGKPRKIPDSAYGSRAININEPANWATFDDALHAFQMGGFDGIGFVFNGTTSSASTLITVSIPNPGSITTWRKPS